MEKTIIDYEELTDEESIDSFSRKLDELENETDEMDRRLEEDIENQERRISRLMDMTSPSDAAVYELLEERKAILRGMEEDRYEFKNMFSKGIIRERERLSLRKREILKNNGENK